MHADGDGWDSGLAEAVSVTSTKHGHAANAHPHAHQAPTQIRVDAVPRQRVLQHPLQLGTRNCYSESTQASYS